MKFNIFVDIEVEASGFNEAREKLALHLQLLNRNLDLKVGVLGVLGTNPGTITFSEVVQKTPTNSATSDLQITTLRDHMWMNEFINTASKLKTAYQIIPVYTNINILIRNGDFQSLSVFFDLIDVPFLSDVLLIGLVRLTYNYQEVIPSWNNFLCECAAELENRGFNCETALKGLL